MNWCKLIKSILVPTFSNLFSITGESSFVHNIILNCDCEFLVDYRVSSLMQTRLTRMDLACMDTNAVSGGAVPSLHAYQALIL